MEVFVVRDFTIPISITLERVVTNPPEGLLINAPGIGRTSGSILENIVQDIKAADRVLVITDRPSANVGFEAGLALGLGKPTLLAFYGAELPNWSNTPPLGNYLQHRFSRVEELRELLRDEDCWFQLNPAEGPPADGACYYLCPQGGDGEALREIRSEVVADWRLTPESTFLLSDLNELLGEAARIVWTIAPYAEGSDQRDGAENAANAIVAGWFYSRCLGHGRDFQVSRFKVLRAKSSRQVVDVAPFEKLFEKADHYRGLLSGIERAWTDGASERRHRGQVAEISKDVNQLKQLAPLLPFIGGDLRRDFAEAREVIDRVSYYKRIHDTLHNIQFLCYMPLFHDALGAGGKIDLGSLSLVRGELEAQLSELEGIAPTSAISVERPSWEIERLGRCVATLGDAIENNDPEILRRAVDQLGSVMNRSPGVFDTRLAEAARGLRVAPLVGALAPLREALSGYPPDAAARQTVERLAEKLVAFAGEQSSLIDRHSRWEEVETRLKMIDTALKGVSAESITEEDLGELRTEWEFLRRETDELARGGTENLYENLRREAQRLAEALERGDLIGSRYGYFNFRNLAAKIFLKVDASLKDLCYKMSEVCKELDSCLTTLEGGNG